MEEEDIKFEVHLDTEDDESVPECLPYDREKDEDDHRQQLERELLAFRIQIGTFTIVSILFLTMCLLIFDAVAQSHHWVYHVPEWFINLCNVAVDAGLLVFSVGVLTAITHAGKTKKIESNKDSNLEK